MTLASLQGNWSYSTEEKQKRANENDDHDEDEPTCVLLLQSPSLSFCLKFNSQISSSSPLPNLPKEGAFMMTARQRAETV